MLEKSKKKEEKNMASVPKYLLNELQSGIKAVLKASRVCRSVQKMLVNEETIKKKDKSPVTVGDYAVQAIIINELTKINNNIPFIAEEESNTLKEDKNVLAKVLKSVQSIDNRITEQRLLELMDIGGHTTSTTSTYWWTLDPIDGTSGFLRKNQFAIALALMENNKPVLGILGCPALNYPNLDPSNKSGTLLYAVKGNGSYQLSINTDNDNDIINDLYNPLHKINVSTINNPTLCKTTESYVVRGYARELNELITKELKINNESLKIDSQCKYAVIARGESDIYLRLTSLDYAECIWDHAAGHIIVHEANGMVTDFYGNELDYSKGRKLVNNKGIVCTNQVLYPIVMKAIKKINPLNMYSNL